MKISAVIPAYNIEAYIGRAIESALRQSRPADEIVVVDDGSTDGTAAEIRKFGERVRLIQQPNGGLSAARNRGIAAAGGEWIAFLDGDDEWLPEHLQRQEALLHRHPELAWSTGNYIRCLCAQQVQAPNTDPARARALSAGREFIPDYYQALRLDLHGCADTMIVRRQALIDAGWFRAGLRRAEDLDLWLRIAVDHPAIGYIPDPSAIYHLERPGCLSNIFTPVELYCDLIERQRSFSAAKGKSDRFQPIAVFLLRRWMRSMLFDARGRDIRRMLSQFRAILPADYRFSMRLLTAFPRVTRAGCRAISRIIRVLRLRRQLQRKP